MKLRYYRTEKGGKLQSEVVLTRPEQEIWYKECLQRILTNTREVLDNLEYCQEYHVNWNMYNKKSMRHKCIECYKEYPMDREKACICGCTKFRTVHYGVGHLRQNLPQKRDYHYK